MGLHSRKTELLVLISSAKCECDGTELKLGFFHGEDACEDAWSLGKGLLYRDPVLSVMHYPVAPSHPVRQSYQHCDPNPSVDALRLKEDTQCPT